MRKKKSRFGSPTVLTWDAPFLGATVKEWDDALTGNMDKSLAEVKRLAEIVHERKGQTTTTLDLVGPAPVRDLHLAIGQEKVNMIEAQQVRFVDDWPISPLPVFVTRTTLNSLLAEEHVDEDDDDSPLAR
jgi:hypothetical protein